MSRSAKDLTILRDLAKQYRGLCDSVENSNRIDLWRNLNSGTQIRPTVWCNVGLLGRDIDAILPSPSIDSTDLLPVERWLQKMLWTATIGDDRVFYPWYTVRAEMLSHPDGVWGVPRNTVYDNDSRGWRDYPIVTQLSDLSRIKATPHRVVNANPPLAEELSNIFDGIIPIHVDRSTIYPKWGGTDLSEAAARLLGLEELMYALYDNSALLHQLMGFMRDAVIENITSAETAGDFSAVESKNYLVPAYCADLPDPVPNGHGASLKDLCFFTHSQEFEAVSPEQHQEFLLRYQMPIMELYGKVAYGCCETLDTKLDLLKTIPNLHKVLAGPLADISLYPERIGDSCIISWRPNAAPMVCQGFDSENVRKRLRNGFEKTRGCSVEVHLHEPMTVQGDLSRVGAWARIAMEEAERIA